MGFYIPLALIFLLGIYLVSRIRIVPEAREYVVERLGVYHATWQKGMHLLIPVLDKIAKQVSTKEQTCDFEPQPVITKDNVTIAVDSVIFYRVNNSKLYSYGVEDPIVAMNTLTTSTLRNIIGNLDLEGCLTSRDSINRQITADLDRATDQWGIKVSRVEIKNITPPREIKEAMDRQMKADREKREAIIRSEGEKQSAILEAEGRRAARIMDAEGNKEAAILNAEAERQKRIREAEGEAEALMLVYKAKAEGIRLLNEAKPSDSVLTIQAYEAFQHAAYGNATKIIVPSNIASVTGLATSIKEILK
ncbi:MAG: SPFH domain-containing protein [Bradymonadales bacterium]|jgi:regulator of protease activity HflC (stomatin/prohibitin superfamily)